MTGAMQFMKSILFPLALFLFAPLPEAGLIHLLYKNINQKHQKVVISLVNMLTNRVTTSYTLVGSPVSIVSEGPQYAYGLKNIKKHVYSNHFKQRDYRQWFKMALKAGK